MQERKQCSDWKNIIMSSLIFFALMVGFAILFGTPEVLKCMDEKMPSWACQIVQQAFR